MSTPDARRYAVPAAAGANSMSRGEFIGLVAMMMSLTAMAVDVMLPALPQIGEALHVADPNDRQSVVIIYMLGFSVGQLAYGRLSDRYGRRPVLMAGMAIFIVGSLLASLATGFGALLAARAVQGLGAAVLFAVALALLANAFQDAKGRGFAIAVWGATIGASFAVGPLVGGALTTGLSWQWIFLVNVPVGAVALWVTATKVRESRDPFPRSLDVPGQLALIAGMFLLVLALLRGNEQGWGSAPIVLELAGAAASLIAFLVIERRSREPMMPLHLFRNPVFTGTQLSVFAISASLFAIYLYVTIYLQNVLGYSAIEAGLALVPGTVVNFVVAGASASFIPKVPRFVPVTAGLTLVAGGMAWMTTLDAGSSWLALQPGMLVAMAGTGMVNTSLSGLALSVLPERQSGLASGIHDSFRQGGIAVGIAALGAFFPAHAGLGQDPAAFVGGLHDALLAGAALAAVGAVAAAGLIRERRPAEALSGAKVAVEAA